MLEQSQIFIKKNQIQITMIVAQTRDGIIGTGEKIPWHIKEDLQFFKQTTMDSNLIMGSKTWRSIGRALPGRKNIILSRQQQKIDSAFAATTPLEALKSCDLQKPVFIIGGSQIYKLFETLVTKSIITIVDKDVENAKIKYNAWELMKKNNWELTEEKILTDIARVYIYKKP